MKVTLSVVKGPKPHRVMEFTEPRGFVIGRAADADFQLPKDDPYVSRRGVLLEICPPTCRLQDIGCTNPPEVNGKPVVECEIADGDILELGYTQFKVSIIKQVAPRMWRCGTYGQSIELLPGEPAPEICPACVEKQRQAAQRAQTAKPVHCSSCRTDLTKQANSDGRAEELQDVAVYACEQHIPPGDMFAGAMVGDYEIRRLLGEGGMGAVYLVYHRRTARVLALKQMKDLTDALLIKRFDREMRLLQGLVHQNVVRYIDMGIDGKGAPYLVTEYVPHGSLADEVAAQGGRLRHDLAVNLIGEVLNGLDYIHGQSKPILHRDIKPQNILLHRMAATGAPGFFTPKLADFGLAVSYARAGGTRLTKTGTKLGTLMFMPPEQIRDAGTVRESADTYAVGVTLYYLLTGQYSFNFPTPGEILEFQKKMKGGGKKPQEMLQALMQLKRILHPFQIILSEEPTPIQKRDPAIPRKLAAVVDKAVRKDAQERFQSAAEFRGALQQAVR